MGCPSLCPLSLRAYSYFYKLSLGKLKVQSVVIIGKLEGSVSWPKSLAFLGTCVIGAGEPG